MVRHFKERAPAVFREQIVDTTSKLRSQMDQGVAILGYLQCQLDDCMDDQDWEERKLANARSRAELEEIVQDVAMALLGRTVDLHPISRGS